MEESSDEDSDLEELPKSRARKTYIIIIFLFGLSCLFCRKKATRPRYTDLDMDEEDDSDSDVEDSTSFILPSLFFLDFSHILHSFDCFSLIDLI